MAIARGQCKASPRFVSTIFAAVMLLATQTSVQEAGPDVNELFQRTVVSKSGAARAREVGIDSDDQELLQRSVIERSAAERNKQRPNAQADNACDFGDDETEAGPKEDEEERDVNELWQSRMVLEKRPETDSESLMQRNVVARSAEERLHDATTGWLMQRSVNVDQRQTEVGCDNSCNPMYDAEQAAARADLTELMQRKVDARSGEERGAFVQAASDDDAQAGEMQVFAQAADAQQLMQRGVVARTGSEREEQQRSAPCADLRQADNSGSNAVDDDEQDEDVYTEKASEMQVFAQAADANQLLQRGVVARTAAEREHQQQQQSACDFETDEDDDDAQVDEMQVFAQAADAQQLMQRGVVARTGAEREEQQRSAPCADLKQADNTAPNAVDDDEQDEDVHAEKSSEMQVFAQAADANQFMQRGVVARTGSQREEQQRSAPCADLKQADNSGSTAVDDDEQDEDVHAEKASEMQVFAQAADASQLLQRGVVARTAAQREEQQRMAPGADACHIGCAANDDDDDAQEAGELQVALQAEDAQQLLQRGVVARTASEREQQQQHSACNFETDEDDDDAQADEMQVAAQAADAQQL